ncbi:MAG: hypothetical protein MJZ99_11520 [Bacteroidales bacterium]|nr:hypothetical protein [Bacteroidales bacterium]
MKKSVISIAMFAFLASMTVGCQKEDYVEPQSDVAEIGTVRTVSYAVDGVAHQVTIIGDDAWNDFLHRMLALCREGHEVFFRDAKTPLLGVKETLTYSAKTEAEAIAWCDAKFKEGYNVGMQYDKDEQVYKCYAIR